RNRSENAALTPAAASDVHALIIVLYYNNISSSLSPCLSAVASAKAEGGATEARSLATAVEAWGSPSPLRGEGRDEGFQFLCPGWRFLSFSLLPAACACHSPARTASGESSSADQTPSFSSLLSFSTSSGQVDRASDSLSIKTRAWANSCGETRKTRSN